MPKHIELIPNEIVICGEGLKSASLKELELSRGELSIVYYGDEETVVLTDDYKTLRDVYLKLKEFLNVK